MRIKLYFLNLLLLFSFAGYSQQVVINEYSCANVSTIIDNNGSSGKVGGKENIILI